LAHGIPARLTPAAGRRFGFTLAGAFAALAAILWWRGHESAASAALGIGAVCFVGGAVAPGRLGPVYRAWMALALLLSKLTTPLFMGLVYYGVVAPIGLAMRLIGKNPIGRRASAATFWVARGLEAARRGGMERPF
jgi:hypothetical protein